MSAINQVLSSLGGGIVREWSSAAEPTRNWTGIVSVTTTGVVVAGVEAGSLYYGNISNEPWTATESASGSQSWRKPASATSTGYVIAPNATGYARTSSNYGGTWTSRTGGPPGMGDSGGAAISGNGAAMAVAAGISMSTDRGVWISADYGATWTKRATQIDWSGVAMSSDGTKLAACVSSGYIWTSTNSGTSWTERTGSGSRLWQAIASSSDGTKLAAVVGAGDLYISTDSGVTWAIAKTGARFDVSMSADGQVIMTFNGSYRVEVSLDGGSTWVENTSFTLASAAFPPTVSVLADGTYAAVSHYGGELYYWE